MYRSVGVVGLCVGLVLGGLTACSESGDSSDPSAAATAVPETEFAEPAASGDQPPAVTYDTTLVPIGATVAVVTRSDDSSTTVELRVDGLVPGREYGAHVHTKPCGAKPADSGPHYQNELDPVTPSTDPAYANADNEVWLDFTADAQGAATAEAGVDWQFRPDGANAAVIHQTRTATHHGKAGTAGDRLACVTAKF